MNDVDELARVLTEHYGHVKPRNDYSWANAPLNVISCVLSLNRRYESFVVPRVKGFALRHPEITELHPFKALMESYESLRAFSKQELNYDHAARAATLLGVVEYLLEIQHEHQGHTEMERLQRWALWARPGDYLAVNVKGFGVAGFQYLRMLFGAQTTKPDVHIIRFVSETLGREVTGVQALYLLERAAK